MTEPIHTSCGDFCTITQGDNVVKIPMDALQAWLEGLLGAGHWVRETDMDNEDALWDERWPQFRGLIA